MPPGVKHGDICTGRDRLAYDVLDGGVWSLTSAYFNRDNREGVDFRILAAFGGFPACGSWCSGSRYFGRQHSYKAPSWHPAHDISTAGASGLLNRGDQVRITVSSTVMDRHGLMITWSKMAVLPHY